MKDEGGGIAAANPVFLHAQSTSSRAAANRQWKNARGQPPTAQSNSFIFPFVVVNRWLVRTLTTLGALTPMG
jgi:hypothetical protein